jgi:hypothetical protein
MAEAFVGRSWRDIPLQELFNRRDHHEWRFMTLLLFVTLEYSTPHIGAVCERPLYGSLDKARGLIDIQHD